MNNLGNFLSDALNVLPGIFAHDFLRYAIIVGAVYLVINGVLSRALQRRRIRERTLPKGQIRRELLTSFRTILVFTGIGMTIWAGQELGALKFYEDPGALGWTWFWVSVALVIILHETWFYWTHRLIHHPRLFRRFHHTHHKSRTPTPMTAYAFDLEEAVINGIYLLLIGALIPLSFPAVLIFTVHMTLRNAIGHCGYELFPKNRKGRPLFDWMTTVTHHDLHHEYAHGNYGLYFSFWDKLMGTERDDYYPRFAKSVGRELPASTVKSGVAFLPLGLAALFLSSAVMTGSSARANEPAPMDMIVGAWATEGYGAVVLLKACENDSDNDVKLCGNLVWAWNPEDIRPGAMDALMIYDFQFVDGKWRNGRLINPEDGRTYKGKITQRSVDILDLKGCAGPFCKTQTWRRLESLPHWSGPRSK